MDGVADNWSGFATHDESARPELWDGIIGAWTPGVGPSGSRLFDDSGFQLNGTLTNMDPPTDWVVSDGRYCLDYDGSNDYVTCGTPLPGSSSVAKLSAACWVRTTASDQKVIFGKYYTTTNQRSFAMLVPSLGWVTAGVPTGGEFAVIVSSDGTTATNTVHWTSGVIINDGAWHHVGFSFNAGTLLVYVDGTVRTPAVHQSSAGSSLYWNSTVPVTMSAVNTLGTPILQMAARSDEYRIWNRVLNGSEFATLAMRRGITCEPRPRRRRAGVTATGNRRRRLLIGAG